MWDNRAMRISAFLLLLCACGSGSTSSQPLAGPASAPDPVPAAPAALGFVPADATAVFHLDLRVLMRLAAGSRMDQAIDQLAQVSPACDRKLLGGVETVTFAFRQLERPDQLVLRLRGQLERAQVQKCLEGIAAAVNVFSVSSKDEDLVLGDAAGEERMVVRWQEGGVLVGPRADLARTAGPANPALKDAISRVSRLDIAMWMAMERSQNHLGPTTFEAMADDGMRLRFAVRYDANENVESETRRAIDDMTKGFLEGAAAKGAAFDASSLGERVKVAVDGRWGLAEAHWTAAEVTDFATRIAEAMAAKQ